MPTPEEYAQWQEYENWNKYQAELAGASPALSAQEPTFMEGLTEGGLLGFAGKVATAPFKAAYGLGELAVNSAKTYANNPAYQQFPMGMGILPAITENIVGGADTPTVDKFANAGRFATGFIPGLTTGIDALTTDKSGYELGKQLNEELSYAPMALAVPAYKAARGLVTGAKDFVAGMPEKELLVRQAGRDDIYANKLNYPNSSTIKEQIQTRSAANAADAFTEANPVAGIDNTLPGEQQIAQFQNNLKTIESTAIRTRAEILPKVAEAQEAAAANGISTTIKFEDIPKSFKTQSGELGLNTLRRKYGDAVVGLADDFMKQEFGMVPEYIGPRYEGAPTRIAPSKALSVEDANFLRQKIDGQIEALGGFDASFWASKNLDPSAANGYAEALRFYRKQLDGVVKDRIKSVLGDEVASAFTKAGENISMTKTYSPMVERFQTQTGEAFAPGSAKRVPPGSGPLGTSGKIGGVVDSLTPGRANARMQAQALTREGDMIRQLQQLVSFRMNQTKPIPRGWAQIKSSFHDLTNVGQIAISMGIVGSLEELTQMPDEQAKQVVGLIAAQAPMLFEPTPDKVDVFDGQFLNPMQKDGLTKQALEKDPKTRFKVIGQGTTQNKYVPLATELPEAVKPTNPVPGIGQLNSMLGGIAPTPAPTPVPTSDYAILEQELNNAILRHSQDYIQ